MTDVNFELSKLPPLRAQKQKLSDLVYEVLSEQIVTGAVRPGQRLREAEVAGALGVSRTPVREAFARLEAQHLLTRDSTGGYLVAIWDKRVLWEVATLRVALEGLAVGLVCTRLVPADYDYLEGVILQMDGAYRRADYQRLINLDLSFHSYLWAHTGHTLLTHQLDQMKVQVRYFMHLTLPGDEKDYATSHQQLLDVLRQEDAEKAVVAIRDHTQTTAERAIRRLNREEAEAVSA